MVRAGLPRLEVGQGLPLAGDEPLLGIRRGLAHLIDQVTGYPLGDLVADLLVGGQEVVGALGRYPDQEHHARPAGTVVYGTGWQIGGARGQVMVDHVIPTKTSVSVSAYEIDGGITSGYSGNWSLTAIARCGPDPGGRQIVHANSPATSDNKLGLVNCPGATVPLGGGL